MNLFSGMLAAVTFDCRHGQRSLELEVALKPYDGQVWRCRLNASARAHDDLWTYILDHRDMVIYGLGKAVEIEQHDTNSFKITIDGKRFV